MFLWELIRFVLFAWEVGKVCIVLLQIFKVFLNFLFLFLFYLCLYLFVPSKWINCSQDTLLFNIVKKLNHYSSCCEWKCRYRLLPTSHSFNSFAHAVPIPKTPFFRRQNFSSDVPHTGYGRMKNGNHLTEPGPASFHPTTPKPLALINGSGALKGFVKISPLSPTVHFQRLPLP